MDEGENPQQQQQQQPPPQPQQELLRLRAPPPPEIQGQPLRSITSSQRSYARFVNRTERSVRVLWVNYNGELNLYKTLPPGAVCDINTYVTHPWLFRDAETGAVLLVNSLEVFYPKPVIPEGGHGHFGPVTPYRTRVYISIPLYTLVERAAQVVGSCLSDKSLAYSLDIPKSLMNIVAKVVA